MGLAFKRSAILLLTQDVFHPPIFRLFSAYFPPEMVPHPYYKLKHVPICCFSAHMFTDSAYFQLFPS